MCEKCGREGYIRSGCYKGDHRWAVDQLIAEFGKDGVRVGFPSDYGRTQGVAVSLDSWKTGRIIVLKGYNGAGDFMPPMNQERLNVAIADAQRCLCGFGS